MELEELRVKESTVKCKMTKTTQKGKEYQYPQYSLTLKKPYVFSKGEDVVVLAGEEVKKVLDIDKAGEVWDGIGKLVETQEKVEEKYAPQLKAKPATEGPTTIENNGKPDSTNKADSGN